jgi:hypothetical protein
MTRLALDGHGPTIGDRVDQEGAGVTEASPPADIIGCDLRD